MIIYREKKIPVIYSMLPFIRKKNGAFVDCKEDEALIRIFQKIINREQELSSIESNLEFKVAQKFPDVIIELEGETERRICYNTYCYNLWDIKYIFSDLPPSEAVDIEELDIDIIEKLFTNISCLDFILKLQQSRAKPQNYYLSQKEIEEIRKIESKLFASIELQKMKQNISKPKSNRKTSLKKYKISPRLRKKILERDNYKCTKCGKTREEVSLDVDHIIPQNLINKIELNKSLLKDEFNLITLCKICNLGKSDYLTKKDIEMYLDMFNDKRHSNNKIIKHLNIIQKLQNL